jgi:hypothetical protein
MIAAGLVAFIVDELAGVQKGSPIEKLFGAAAIAAKTATVREKLRDRDAGNVWMEPFHEAAGRVEPELVLFAQLQDSGCREALRLRADANLVAGGKRLAGR